MSNRLDPQYKELLEHILHFGVEKKTRNGNVLSIFGWQMRHKMSEGFPMLTVRKIAFKTMVVEALWILKGRTDLKYLLDNDCMIWVGDSYQSYRSKASTSNDLDCLVIQEEGSLLKEMRLYTQEEFINKIKTDDEFAKKFGDFGPIYGAAWRRYSGASYIPHPRKEETVYQEWHRMGHNSVALNVIDQVKNLVDELKINPDGRRHLVSAWNPSLLSEQILPPCHYSWQVYTRELSDEERAKWLQDTKGYDLLVGNLDHDHVREVVENESPTRAISLMWNQRSADVPLGTPTNYPSYALILSIIAREVNMIPEEVICSLGDCHIYENQIEPIKEIINRQPYYKLPTLKMTKEFDDIMAMDISFSDKIDMMTPSMFVLEDYQYHPKIYIPLSN